MRPALLLRVSMLESRYGGVRLGTEAEGCCSCVSLF
jgi:hypothetical protein